MMKKILSVLMAFIIFASFQIIAFAREDFTDDLEKQYTNQIFNSLSDEVKEIIENSNINLDDIESIINVSPGDIVSFFLNIIKGKIRSPLKNISVILIILTIVSICFTYLEDDIKTKKYINMILSILLFLIISKSILSLIKATCASLNLISSLMGVLLPILAGLIAACRNPMLAFTLNSATIYLSNLITYFSNRILSPFTYLYFVLSVASCTFTTLDISKLCNSIKNLILKILGVISSFFISVLSLKGLLANSIDSLSLKSTKLLISNVIPVIGSNLSEAYSTVSYSLSLLKNSVGIIGIVALLCISLPMVLEIFFYNISFFICENIAIILNLDESSRHFEAICSVLKILNLILIFSSVVLIISVGIMISMRGSV